MGDLLEKEKHKRNTRDQNTITKMKNAFDELIGRPDTDEKRISELEDISQFLKLKSKEKKTEKKIN